MASAALTAHACLRHFVMTEPHCRIAAPAPWCLQGFQVTGDQLERCISGLIALQQLHVHDTDPWLLHSGQMTAVATALTCLTLVTRDGWELLNVRGSSSSSSSAAAAELAPAHGAAGSGCSCGGHASSERGTLRDWGLQLAGMASSARRPASGSPQPPEAAAAPAGSSGSGQRPGRRSNSGTGVGSSSSASASAARRLSAFDERHRYSTQQLLALRGGGDSSGDGGAAPARGLHESIPLELRRV